MTQTEKQLPRTYPLILRIAAQIFSYIFHPVFLPVAMTFLLYVLYPASFAGSLGDNIGITLIRVAYITSFFPLLTVLLLKGLGFLSSIHMPERKDRIIPLIATMIFYFWAYNVFKNIEAPFLLRVILLGCFWGIILVFMCNIFVKISMHTAATGSMVGFFLLLIFALPVNMSLPLCIAIVIAGLVGSSRMLLSAHQPGDIWLGYIVGLIVHPAAYWFLL